MRLNIVVDGRSYEVEVEEADEAGRTDASAAALPPIQSAVLAAATGDVSSDFDEAKVCRSPLAGVVARIEVRPGQPIKKDQLLLVLDAMKMEIKVAAQTAATVRSIEVSPNDAVRPHQVLICFE